MKDSPLKDNPLSNNSTGKILEKLKEKAVVKQCIYHQGKEIFAELKSILKEIVDDIKPVIEECDERVELSFKESNELEAEIKFGGDVLVFSLHTNVFTFEKDHEVHTLPYVREDESRSYFNMIQVHNFLADSLKYQRMKDLGYLIARIFINIDKHFFVEGKRQLGFLYNDLSNMQLNAVYLRAIIEASILHAIDFELFVPPYQEVKEITVQQRLAENMYAQQTTAKRLGFQFSALQD